MPFLLMILLMFACMLDLEIWQGQGSLVPEQLGFGPIAWSLLQTGLAVALVVLSAWWMARRVVVTLRRDPNLHDVALKRYERRRFFHQFALLAVLGLALFVFGWGQTVTRWQCDNYGILPGAELLLITPFFIAMLLSWLFFYDADRASHQAIYRSFDLDPLSRALLGAHEVDIAASHALDSHRDFGGRLSYVVFQLRQKLALILIPIGLLLLHKDLQRFLASKWAESWLPSWWIEWQMIINLFGSVFVFVVAMPWAVRLALGLKPMPAGPMRDRLIAAAKRLRFRCSDILWWNTRSGMANAMVVGLLPCPRYVVFTDRLLEDFTAGEVEAVFGHEVGHVKHYHMFYYLGFLSLSITILGMLVCQVWPELAGSNPQFLKMIPLGLGVIAYIFVVFGFLSRRCERQADVYGCRAVSCTSSNCFEHAAGAPLAERGQGLCATGIRTFIQALEKVALINGMSRDRPGFLQSWQHSTIAKRVEFLQRVLVDARVERTFQRRVALVKWALAVMLGFALAGAVVALHAHDPEDEKTPPVTTGE